MHDTGIVRRVDDLGRIVIPMELRRELGIKVKDPLEIYVDGERVILEKPKNACTFCSNESKKMRRLHGRRICPDCIKAIKDS